MQLILFLISISIIMLVFGIVKKLVRFVIFSIVMIIFIMALTAILQYFGMPLF
ncbi:MAG: hypothetical protein ACK5ML_10120 [Lachnospiraceae bacterium]